MTDIQYAILQSDYAFFGVGSTKEGAVADAREWTDDRTCDYRDCTRGQDHDSGEMIMVRVTPELGAIIEEDGERAARQAVVVEPGLYGLAGEQS